MSLKRKIAVLGSNAFSAADFIDLLLEDKRNSVIGISRSREKSTLYLPYKRHKNAMFRFYQLDMNKKLPEMMDALDRFKPEYIVNFAGQIEVATSWQHPDHYFTTNTTAVTRLAHALKDRKYLKKYFHISTPEVYGSCQGNVKEDCPMNPSTPYAASKAAADMSLMTYFKNYNFPVVTVRSTNVYGPHQQLFRIIPRTMVYIRMGKKIQLHGGGRAVKSFIHIRDISRGELAIMEKGVPGEVYHLSPDGDGTSIKDLVGTICRRLGVDFVKATEVVGERLGQDAFYRIDSSKVRRELGWQPQISLEQGTQSVYDWVDANWKKIEKEPLGYTHKA